MRDVLDQAHEEAATLRSTTHRELADHVRDRRQAAQALVTTAEHNARESVALAEAEAARVRARPKRSHGRARGRPAVAPHGTHRRRAPRRRGAGERRRAYRSRAAPPPGGRARSPPGPGADRCGGGEAAARAHESRREARAELVRSVSSARTEADQLRAEARGMLDRARAEVAALAKRRDDITAQLGTLSGSSRPSPCRRPHRPRTPRSLPPDNLPA